MTEQDDIKDLQEKMKGFDGKTTEAVKQVSQNGPIVQPDHEKPIPVGVGDKADIEELQHNLGIMPGPASNPCEGCDQKDCTTRNSGMANINCKKTVEVLPGGMMRTTSKTRRI